jgi:hypothetical protein
VFTGNSRTIKKEQFRYCAQAGGPLFLFQKLIDEDGNLKTSNILITVLKNNFQRSYESHLSNPISVNFFFLLLITPLQAITSSYQIQIHTLSKT